MDVEGNCTHKIWVGNDNMHQTSTSIVLFTLLTRAQSNPSVLPPYSFYISNKTSVLAIPKFQLIVWQFVKFTRWCHGSPVHRYGLYALQWILEVNGKPTPDLDAFVNVTKVYLLPLFFLLSLCTCVHVHTIT